MKSKSAYGPSLSAAECLRAAVLIEVATHPVHFRVFLASPSDVADERALAHKVLNSLQYQPFIRNRATIETVAWDIPLAETTLYASLTPQEAINRQLAKPSECDIVIVIL